MNFDDKNLLEQAKKILGVQSYKEVAKAIGMAETTAINWSSRNLSKHVRAKISHLIDSQERKDLSDVENDILSCYRQLPVEFQEFFYHGIRAAAATTCKTTKDGFDK